MLTYHSTDRKHAEAIEVLSQLFDAPKDHPSVLGQKSEIDQAVALEEVEGPWKFQELFKNGPLKVRRRFFLGAGMLPRPSDDPPPND